MIAKDVVADVLLALAVCIVFASTIGVTVMRDPAQKLHYVSPASLVAPVLVALAVVVQMGWYENSAMTWMALFFMAATSPFLSHATIRAIRIRQKGDWRPGRAGGEPSGEAPSVEDGGRG